VISLYQGSISNAEGATALLNEERSPDNLINAVHLLQEKDKASGPATLSTRVADAMTRTMNPME
jgi:hypothetical protein